MNKYKIYAIRNEITGQLYIGVTKRTIEKRFIEHKFKSSGCVKLKEAFDFFKRKNFTIEQIDSSPTLKYAYVLETDYIKMLNTKFPNGYNFTDGGLYYPLEKEIRLKVSLSKKGKKCSADFKEKCRMRMLGNQFALGHIQSDETKKKRSISLKGRFFSEEHRKKISNALKGRIIPNEHIEYLKKINTGIKRTEEFKQRTSLIQKNREPKGKYRGICFLKRKNKWIAGIKINGKKILLGQYLTDIEAAIAWNEGADKYWGLNIGYRNVV